MGTLFFLVKIRVASALDVSEYALILFSALVVLGLIGEHAERWKKHIKFFEVLVIIGVAGELLADGGVFLFSSQLQTISDRELKAAVAEAGTAKTSAEGAVLAAEHARALSGRRLRC